LPKIFSIEKQRIQLEIRREKARERALLWRAKNRERANESSRRYGKEHPEKAYAAVKAWCLANPERIKENKRRAKERDPHQKARYCKQKRAEDPQTKLAGNLRTRIRDVLRGRAKTGSAVRDLGCTMQELQQHLEKQFYPRHITGEVMTWDNYGQWGWHVDHIKPLIKFDLADPVQFKEAVHFSNLRPLWSEDNLKKNRKEDSEWSGSSRLPQPSS
jgi:hypothetical protein